ncbi:unnamed protein product [Boreogadus saida]
MEGERCVALPPQWEDGGAADRASPTPSMFIRDLPISSSNVHQTAFTTRCDPRGDCPHCYHLYFHWRVLYQSAGIWVT